MANAFGLSANGFHRKRLADIKTELETAYKLIFGDNIDTTSQSVFGQIIGIHSVREADLWEQSESVYNSFYPTTAQGEQLSNLVTLNGVVRQVATKSTVIITCTGTDALTIPQGSLVSTSDSGEQFVSLSDGIISGGTVDIAFESVNAGAVEASIGTLTVIDTPIFGWTTANNANVAVLGQNDETDAELRVRRTQSTSALGQNLTDSLFSQLLNIPDVTGAVVISNGTSVIDGNGIPPHQFLTVVEGGEVQVVADTIWRNTPQGILSFGVLSANIIDAQGFTQTVKYSNAVEVDIFFSLTITTNASFPLSGEDDIKEAMVSFGLSNFNISDDVLLSQFYTPINAIEGVTSIDLKVGLTSNPTGTVNIPIAVAEKSTYDISRISVSIV